MRPHAARFRIALLLALPSFVAAHDLIFLITYGARNVGAALGRDGHGAQWTATVVSAAMTATVLIGAGGWRLLALAREARTAHANVIPRSAHVPRSFLRLVHELVAVWPLILLGAMALFAVVENIEHLAIGLPAPGLAVLASTQYVDAPLVLAVVSGLVALVAALYAWERDVLVRSIAVARQRWARRSKVSRPQSDPMPRRRSLSGVRLSGRAPPTLARIPVQA